MDDTAIVLRSLAARCEKEQPSQEINDLVSRWFGRNMYGWWRELVRSGSRFTLCVDDAVTLVPAYWRLCNLTENLVGGDWTCTLKCNHPDYGGSKDGEYVYATAKTEAAARTAAALKAHAHTIELRSK